MTTNAHVVLMTSLMGLPMAEFKVEVIFEPTGDYMTFRYEAEAEDEEALLNEVLSQLSIVSWKEEE
jgi:hypothetical protein